MHYEMNSRGITLVELIIAISLLTIVLSGAYFLLDFSTNSFKDTQAQYIAQQDARIAFISLEDDIRKAQTVSFGGTSHKACEVQALGMQLNVYTDTDNDNTMELVQYKLVNNKLRRGVAELGSTPANWTTIAGKVRNNLLTPATAIFTISNEVVNINLILTDEKDWLAEDPFHAYTSITVRSKGAMD